MPGGRRLFLPASAGTAAASRTWRVTGPLRRHGLSDQSECRCLVSGKFTGQYRRDQAVLTVTRDNHRLLVMRPGFGTREITADSVENWQWHDACGVQYRFTLPPDGPGAWLRITDAVVAGVTRLSR